MLWFWIIFFVMSCIGAKISLIANAQGGKWFIILCVLNAIPYFPLMALWTKNILIDSIIYDVLICGAYIGVYIALGQGKAFGLIQYAGLVLTILGILLMKSR